MQGLAIKKLVLNLLRALHNLDLEGRLLRMTEILNVHMYIHNIYLYTLLSLNSTNHSIRSSTLVIPSSIIKNSFVVSSGVVVLKYM